MRKRSLGETVVLQCTERRLSGFVERAKWTARVRTRWPDLTSPSHEEVDNEDDQQHAANATSDHRAPIIVPTTASEKEQQNQNNQDEVHMRILLDTRQSLYRMRGMPGLMVVARWHIMDARLDSAERAKSSLGPVRTGPAGIG